MIHSMTGYAQLIRELPQGSLALELRSVNSRFLDIQFRIADDLRSLEPQYRELIGNQITRGKVDCRLSYGLKPLVEGDATINRGVLDRLVRLITEVKAKMPDVQPMRVSEVLNWPGILGDTSGVFEAMRVAAVELMHQGLRDLTATRSREGARLAEMIRSRTAQMRERLKIVEPLVPTAIAAYQDKLTQKLREVLGTGEDERIRQEIAVYGIKIDVAEEITRLAAHLDEVDRVVGRGGQVGKRLDFLMQELNREANTLASKQVSKDVSDAAVELKLSIEQIREQVQNLE